MARSLIAGVCFVHGGGGLGGEKGDQGRDVFPAFAQRRKADEVGAEAIIEIHAKLAVPAGQHGQILVGGGDDPGLALLRLVGAERIVDIFLEEPEQFDLGNLA